MKTTKHDTGYILPVRTPGQNNKSNRLALATDPAFLEAVRRVAESETKRLGVKISQSTLLLNLSMQGSNEFRAIQSELRSTYENIKRKDKHHVTDQPTQQDFQAS